MNETKQFQIAVDRSNAIGVVALRFLDNGAGEWKYLIPPINVGKEYLTTERQSGYPVYVKRVSCGAVPSNGSKVVTFANVGIVKSVVRVDAKMQNSAGDASVTLPILETDGTGISIHAASSGEIYIVATKDASTWTACYADVYYVKN